jgi:hypothetical protein
MQAFSRLSLRAVANMAARTQRWQNARLAQTQATANRPAAALFQAMGEGRLAIASTDEEQHPGCARTY